MANRPAQICQLEKGKLIDGQIGFVDTFNWVAQSMANLEGGENCEVNWTVDDHPTIDVTASEEGGDGGGGGTTAAVYDVYDSYDGGERALEIEYTDDRQNKYIPLNGGGSTSCVYNVVDSTHDGERALEIQYVDDRPYSYITLSGGGVEISANNSSTGKQTSFQLSSRTDSNIQFSIVGNTIYIGAYYI